MDKRLAEAEKKVEIKYGKGETSVEALFIYFNVLLGTPITTTEYRQYINSIPGSRKLQPHYNKQKQILKISFNKEFYLSFLKSVKGQKIVHPTILEVIKETREAYWVSDGVNRISGYKELLKEVVDYQKGDTSLEAFYVYYCYYINDEILTGREQNLLDEDYYIDYISFITDVLQNENMKQYYNPEKNNLKLLFKKEFYLGYLKEVQITEGSDELLVKIEEETEKVYNEHYGQSNYGYTDDQQREKIRKMNEQMVKKKEEVYIEPESPSDPSLHPVHPVSPVQSSKIPNYGYADDEQREKIHKMTEEMAKKREETKAETVDGVIRPTNMEELIYEVNKRQQLNFNSITANYNETISSFFKKIKYILGDKVIIPFATGGKEFTKALQEYSMTKDYVYDVGTNHVKIAVSFGKEFNENYRTWEKDNRVKRVKINDGVITYEGSFYDSLAPYSDIPESVIHYSETSDKIKRYIEFSILKKEGGCLAVMAPPGSGKTEAVRDYVKTLPEDEKITAISFRCVLGEKQMADFEGLGFYHYQDPKIKGGFIDTDVYRRNIIQIDSLARLFFKYDSAPVGLLIIDEIESMFEHLCSSPFIKNPSDLMYRLASLIREAKKVIIMDANLSYGTIMFLREICGKDVYIYRNTYIRNRRVINILANQYHVEDTIIKFLKEGKKVYVPTNSRDWGRQLMVRLKNFKDEVLPNLTYKLYDKDCKFEKGKDPISDMINYDCCITTPKFQAGNSFTADHFDVVCGYFSGASCSPKGASQLIMRVRNVKDPNVYLNIDNRIGKGKTPIKGVKTFDDMIEFMKQYSKSTMEDFNFYTGPHHFVSVQASHRNIINLEDPHTYMSIINKFNMNAGYIDYTKTLLSLLKSMGFSFGKNLVPTTEEEITRLEEKQADVTKGIRKTREIDEAKFNEAIAKAVLPDEKTYEAITKKIKQGEATKEEIVQVKKKNLLKDVQIHEVHRTNPIMYKKAMDIRYQKKLINKMLPTTLVGIPQDKLDIILVNTFKESLGYKGEEPSNKNLVRFYELDNAVKLKTLMILYSILRRLGFEYGFFELRSVNIADTKEEAAKYLRENEKMLAETFNVDPNTKLTENQKSSKGIIKWLNDKLRMYLNIFLQRRTTRSKDEYVIKSNWVFCPTADKSISYGIEVKDLEIECVDVTKQTHTENFVKLIKEYEQEYLYQNHDMINGVTFEDSYKHIPRLTKFKTKDGITPQVYTIINRALWDKHVRLNQHDEEFNRKVREIYNGQSLLDDYNRELNATRSGYIPILWDEFLDKKFNKQYYPPRKEVKDKPNEKHKDKPNEKTKILSSNPLPYDQVTI
jgi:hypothetical protein